MKNTLLMTCLLILARHETPHFSKERNKNEITTRTNTVNDQSCSYRHNQWPTYKTPCGSLENVMLGDSIWAGLSDIGVSHHSVANTCKQNGADFWPGPLDTTSGAAFLPTIIRCGR